MPSCIDDKAALHAADELPLVYSGAMLQIRHQEQYDGDMPEVTVTGLYPLEDYGNHKPQQGA